jgi:hypothetical protein
MSKWHKVEGSKIVKQMSRIILMGPNLFSRKKIESSYYVQTKCHKIEKTFPSPPLYEYKERLEINFLTSLSIYLEILYLTF